MCRLFHICGVRLSKKSLDKYKIGDKIADKFVTSAGNFSNEWANKVIKKWKTAFTGKTAKTELYRGEIRS